MAYSLVNTSALNNTQGPSITRYFPVSISYLSLNSTEANVSAIFRTAGVLSGLVFRVGFNGLQTSTLQIRKNSSTNGNAAVSIPTTTTGQFTESSDISDSVTAGDTWAFSLTTGANASSLTIVNCNMKFFPSDNTLTMSKFISNNDSGLSLSAISTEYLSLTGFLSKSATEADMTAPFYTAGTLKNMSIYVSANSRTNSSSFGSRIAGSPGNLAISVSASSTGSFEDTSNTDSVTSGNDINFYKTFSAGSGTLTLQQIGAEFITSYDLVTASIGNTTNGSATTTYYICAGSHGNFTESWVGILANIRAIFANLTLIVKTNSLDSGTSTFKLRYSSSSHNLSVSITFATTGEFTDTSNTDRVGAANTFLCYQLITSGTSGSFVTTGASIIATPLLLKGVIQNKSIPIQV